MKKKALDVHFRKAIREVSVSKDYEELNNMINQKWPLFSDYNLDAPEAKANMKVTGLNITPNTTKLIPFITFLGLRNIKLLYDDYSTRLNGSAIVKVSHSKFKEICSQKYPCLRILDLSAPDFRSNIDPDRC